MLVENWGGRGGGLSNLVFYTQLSRGGGGGQVNWEGRHGKVVISCMEIKLLSLNPFPAKYLHSLKGVLKSEPVAFCSS